MCGGCVTLCKFEANGGTMTGAAGEERPLGEIDHVTTCMHSKSSQAALVSLLGGVTILIARRTISKRRERADTDQEREPGPS